MTTTEITADDIELANARARRKESHYPRAVAVRYDRRIARLVIELESGLGLTMTLKDLQGLQEARPEDLEGAEISPSGFGIHFPLIDMDLYLPGLLEGFLGTKRWMAARNGQVGGKVSNEAKAAAARENGKRGGRPRKPKEPVAA